MFFNYNPIIIPGLLARNHPEVISTPLASILPLSLVTSHTILGLIVAKQQGAEKIVNWCILNQGLFKPKTWLRSSK